ncbi:MAG: alpha-L-rhamnosidase N-terminal domain-containing protein [Parabacteroides sp.]|nr:alpha-L-rhamnosidase N-terminal domain-containing protein [Parabacteroides sp.]
MRNKRFSLMTIICFMCMMMFISIPCTGNSNIRPTTLTCEYMQNPRVVDVQSPRLSWINEVTTATVRGESQKAYRIVVASSEENLQKSKFDAWDSGKIYSSDSYLVSYKGCRLLSSKDYWWKVMVWDSKDNASSWSETSHWGMGLLSSGEWKAQWIGAPWQGEEPRKIIEKEQIKPQTYPSYPAPLFRKTFTVNKEIKSAKAFVTGLGYFEFYINGKKVGNDCLVPNFTNYTVRNDLKNAGIAIDNNFRGYRVLYLSYDITSLLQKKNVAGAIVGDGFYDCTSHWVSSFGSPRFLCQIEITYKDGKKQYVYSDNTWKVKASPIIMNGVYDGEIYDANRETDNWATTLCDDSRWETVVLRQAPSGELKANTSPTDKVTEVLHPLSVVKQNDGTYAVDFGKEISGWIHFKNIRGTKGDTLNVKYVCESPLGVQKYIFKGGSVESYAPRFTWYVFSKAVISGINNLTDDMLTAEAVNTDVRISSVFKTSNDLFNKINEIWERSQLDNMHGCIASDCPHRERSPYTGDGQVACVTVMHNFDAAAFYTKWIRDMRDAQNMETGYIPNGAPWQPGCGGGVAWGAAMNIMPWEFYLHYGDKKMLEENYVAMKEQLRHMLTWQTKEGTMYQQKTNLNETKPLYWLNLGDWAPSYKNPSDELVHTFYLWRCADYTAKAAKALGKMEDYQYYSNISDKVKQAFNSKFYDAKNKTYGDYGSNIYALKIGVPQERLENVKSTLRTEIVQQYKGHLNTGMLGTQFFFETLAANDMNDLAVEAMNKRDFPSYGNWIKQGATTTWEQWNGTDSRNHPMLGGGLTWFYRILAGVNADENEPGYKHLIIKPVLSDVEDVYYSNMTPYGKVVSEIRNHQNSIEMNVTVPVGSHATIYIPIKKINAIIKESGTEIAKASSIKVIGHDADYYVVNAKQGSYNFTVK